jgi:hypothetical protein
MFRLLKSVRLITLVSFAAPLTSSIQAAVVYGLTVQNAIVTFNSAAPGTVQNTAPITGIGSGETILGIDIRPANLQLYGLGSQNNVYTINPMTGAAIRVGAGGAFTLTGTDFGFDFNPVPDRMRVTSDADQNLRLNPNDGTLTATDGTLAYSVMPADVNAGVNPNIVASAYINNFAGATATTLYGIDSNLDILVIQNPPNDGTLTTVGPLGFNTSGLTGFDVFNGDGTAYASLTAPAAGASQLYTINLATGSASLVGTIGGGVALRDITAQSVPEPASLALVGAALASLALWRRRRIL